MPLPAVPARWLDPGWQLRPSIMVIWDPSVPASQRSITLPAMRTATGAAPSDLSSDLSAPPLLDVQANYPTAVEVSMPTDFTVLPGQVNVEQITAYPGAAQVGGTIQGAPGQTADLYQWVNSSGTVLARVDCNGNFSAASVIVPGITNWLNVKSPPYGAAGNGSTDDTAAINAAISAASSGQTVYLPQGQYLLNGSAYLNLATSGVRLVGDGPKATSIVIGPTFSGSQAAFLGAEGTSLEGMTVSGLSTTTTSNPACDAVYLGGFRFCRVLNCEFEYVNGWCINSVATSSNAGYGTMISRISSYKQCAGGIHIQSNSNVTWGAQHFLTDINLQQIGVSTGPAANRDALMLEDAFDVLVQGYNGGICGSGQVGTGNVAGGTGATYHIKGNCATIYSTNCDLGCFPNNSAGNGAGVTNSTYLIEHGTNGNPSDIRFTQAIGQQSAVGLTISAGSNIKFLQSRFTSNYTHGVAVTGTGSDIILEGCRLGGNGQSQTGTNYDLNWSGAATGYVRYTNFNSPIVPSGTAAGVQQSINIATGGQDVRFTDCPFTGTSASGFTTAFGSNIPVLVRACRGCNPKGSVSIGIPSTTNSTTALGYDAMFYITAGTLSVTVQRSNSGPSVIIPAGQLGTVWLPAGQTLKYTYSGTGNSQVVDGQ